MVDSSRAAEVDSRSSLLARWGPSEASEWAEAARGARELGALIFDLINASPLQHGLAFPADLLADVFRDASRALHSYRPDARGQVAAREAVAVYHGGGATADQVILTPGTSLAYLYCFRLLAAAGEEILCPTPTYPLFDDIAALAGVRVRRYHLNAPVAGTSHWSIDPDELRFQITPRTRAIVLVSPHNPTGSVISDEEMRHVCSIAREHGLAVILDEVFREQVHAAGPRVVRPSAYDAPLSITLNGLSKMVSLPGLKAGWMVVEGDAARREQLLSACEYLSDTLLPVSEITQAVLPELMRLVPSVSAALRERLTSSMLQFVDSWKENGIDVQVPEAGPYLPVPLPPGCRRPDTEIAVELARSGVLLHAGSSYGLEQRHLVTTCISAPPWPISRVAEAVRRATA